MRRRNLIALLILTLAIGAGGYVYYQQMQAETVAEETETPLQTATVRRGDITISATGAGTVIPASEIALAFESAGTLSELNVVVGQRVREGDLLAVLDDADIQKALADAELAVRQAGLQLNEEVRNRSIGLAEIQVEQAALNLEIAQRALADARAFRANDDQVEQAALALQLAQTNFQNTQRNTTDFSIDLASAELNLQAARTELNELNSWTPDWQQVQALKAQYDAAKASLDVTRQNAGSSESSLVSLQVARDQAYRNLASAEATHENVFNEARDWERVSHECKT
ncbi:MAG: biotin/lipoyl-binding protein, partial [Candidatus Promineifilaceae bacterium]